MKSIIYLLQYVCVVDRLLLTKLREQHPTSSWAIWSEDFPEEGCVEDNPSELFEYIYERRTNLHPSIVLLSLNPSTSMPSDFQNFHSTKPKHRNDQFQKIIEENGLEGSYMTDLVEEIVEVNSGKVEATESNVENLFKQLEMLDQDEYYIICFLRPVFRTLLDYFDTDYEKLPHNIKSFSAEKNGIKLNCYRVWFHANWGANQDKMPELHRQLSYINKEVG